MSKVNSKLRHVLVVAAGMLLVGCGGGGGGSTTASSDGGVLPGSGGSSVVGTAYLVDSPVKGVAYNCGSQHGITDEEGAFRFEVGKGCTFTLGNIRLRTLEETQLSDGALIIESDMRVDALLQSLDADADPTNGIEIKEEVVSALKEQGILKVPETENELTDVVEKVAKRVPSLDITPVSFAKAAAHLKESYAKYADSGVRNLKLTDEDAFNQIASGPVLYSIPVLASEIPYDRYRLAPLTDEDFNALTEEQKYKVAIKLYGTLFYGVDYDTLVEAVNSGSFISDTRALFDRQNSPAEIAAVEEKMKYYDEYGWGDNKIVASMLARLYELQPGRAYINRWAAYILSQTILFSPAYELDTVYTVDAIDVYGDLVRDFDAGFSMQWVTFTHMMTDENWRRFRSPEDNGREMLEIYTMDFNDAHVPLAAKALKNWKLDRRSNTLVMTLDENVEPITDLFPGQVIKNGTDFYSALVLQPTFVPAVTRRLVDLYFPNFTEERKNRVVDQLIASRPMTWTGLLKQIVYSKAYLLESAKTRSFEESFYQIAKALKWLPKAKSFYYIARNLDSMHQSTMRYKLGRKVEVPLDSQSFAWFHKTIRENVMTNYERNASLQNSDDGWPYYELFENLPADLISPTELGEDGRRLHEWAPNERRRAGYIVDSLFLSIAGRKAAEEERNFLIDLIDDEKDYDETFDNLSWIDLYGNRKEIDDLKERGEFAMLVLDYLSRLDSIYEFQAVK
ncbi:hypothetical protein [Hydrogenimonas urashimensis]|uniref:hypothetical protein n=1 Tax=Hydrogenimonas urashimensis TaxID=2740515 RepID=UPI001916B28C|nr:hypothetical protein [Hydrogenimonas urashimensis]